jgi:hypothetical protein
MSTTYEIHPAIGIARVGSSRSTTDDGFFLGPEPGVSPPAKYRDSAGDLKRQAARFRIFECERDDQKKLLKATELTLDLVDKMTWTVHLVNRKGTARRQYGSGPGFRNHFKSDPVADRDFIIDPGARSVSEPGIRELFDTGKFRSTTVPLGEIVMEDNGRLRVLGGFGHSGSDLRQPRLDDLRGHCVDNRQWYDDTSDGPVSVRAELKDGTVVESTAWIIVGPPDFAPGIKNFVTLYDLIFDLAVSRQILAGPADPPNHPSFTRHIQPILARALGYRWVNRAASQGYEGDRAHGHGPGAPGAFSEFWKKLADPSSAASDLRMSLFKRLRSPDRNAEKANLQPLAFMPRLRNVQRGGRNPDDVLPLPAAQYRVMQAWGKGDFINDLGQAISNDLLPDALDQMALDACVGGALDPGVEAGGFVLRNPERYLDGEPFRLSPAAVKPGEVTLYNAVPWQADFMVCQWEELEGPWPRRLGWWPAQRPDDVYTGVGDTEMVSWVRGLGTDFQDMVDKWDRLGIVVDRGASGSPFFIEVERDGKVLGS